MEGSNTRATKDDPLNAALSPAPAPDACAAALVHLATPVLLAAAGGPVVFANRAACTLLGCEEAPGLMLDALFASCGVDGRIALPQTPVAATEARIRLSDGRAVLVSARLLPDGGVALTLDDISAFAGEAAGALEDALTGLNNRAALHRAVVRTLAEQKPGALLAVDLNRFKSINDTLGRTVGDALLRKVAERLLSLAGAEGLVARITGTEFAILKPELAERDEAERFARRVIDLVGRSYALEGHMINVAASVGIARLPDDGHDADVALKHAELALHRARSDGTGRFRFFEPAMDEAMQARRAMELDLRRALALKEFELAYQPQVDLASQKVVGFEALLRWRSPARGLVSPADFIPIAEETGLIVPIGEWVLRTACQVAAQWPDSVSIAVNLSPLQFGSQALVQSVLSALRLSGLPAARLELEITEGALIEDTQTVVALLKSLRELGVRVSMDDFGTGYSSLSYLQKFPFDKIKIDQSFVRGMGENAEATAIVRAVARLGATLGMTTTAEGVETEEQLAAIRREGCTQVQGYLTGRPMSAADAGLLLGSDGV